MEYYWPIVLIVVSNVFYHVCSKSTPAGVHPLASLTVTYLVGAAVSAGLYLLLPQSFYPYIGMIGGIGVGYSAGYAWQTAFNTFGALSIASGLFGMPYAVALRIGANVFSAVYTVVCSKGLGLAFTAISAYTGSTETE